MDWKNMADTFIYKQSWKKLHDEDIINQQKEIEIMKNHPEVKKILKEFPESKIHAITELGEINDGETDINQPKMKKEK